VAQVCNGLAKSGWWLYDASRLPPKLIAAEAHGGTTVKQKKLYRQIEHQAEETHEEAI
jgi:hypothetical protein